jgi:DNA-damage-inducible protein D
LKESPIHLRILLLKSNKNNICMENKIIVFENKEIRRVWHQEDWWFSVIDIIEALTGSKNPRKYWNTLKSREPQLSSICGQLKMTAADGRERATDAANTEGVFRIIMSIPSPKAEPFKLWLAQVGRERLEEIENPELSFERIKAIYKATGYSDEWIERRVQTLEVRKQLTDEWKQRNVKEGQEYAILTATIAKGTFGLTPSEHKHLKKLEQPKQNLRDHMTPLELIFTALSEETTRILARKDDAQGFNENHVAAYKGGQAAGEARERIEASTGETVVSNTNYLDLKKPLMEPPKDETNKLELFS